MLSTEQEIKKDSSQIEEEITWNILAIISTYYKYNAIGEVELSKILDYVGIKLLSIIDGL